MRNYNSFKDILSISDYSRVRKHRQIINSVLSATTIGSLKLNDKLPSVNELAIDCNISRDTVVRAYTFLKENDIIDSIPGKGYYIKSITNKYKPKVFLLLNSLSPQMKKIYDAFAEALQDRANIDVYIYQNDYNQFKNHILDNNTKEYTHYVLATNFEDKDYIDFIKNEVAVDKLILLEGNSEQLGDEIACVYQNLESDFFQVLEELECYFRKYKGIKLVLPKNNKIPNEIRDSLAKFCHQYHYKFRIVEDLNNEKLERNTVYVNFDNDESLVNLIKKINCTDFVLGKDIGLLSYDDNPLKELLAGGITVISHVFEKIGYQLADTILNNESEQLLEPLNVIIRKSL
ncbi:GntR family transcriptional regulator [Flavobacterium sufflavum]|uniref:GntR family transcriptional regulator n=1 Tax=Flavobacterium sufflavum TaxID=1921138 RepID=A0A437KLM9_9FLAO|nr:GntR family transcriptional regulator [Flavobacterium sufflavum]RVT71991.1 GntR family transcriptional regulator [Flavobacterium sufflavum]